MVEGCSINDPLYDDLDSAGSMLASSEGLRPLVSTFGERHIAEDLRTESTYGISRAGSCTIVGTHLELSCIFPMLRPPSLGQSHWAPFANDECAPSNVCTRHRVSTK
jgi:hypothetical protein